MEICVFLNDRAPNESFLVNSADYDLRRPIHLAASEGRLKFVQMLHEYGAELSSLDRWGCTPLSEARRYGRVSVEEYFVNNGAIVGTGER